MWGLRERQRREESEVEVSKSHLQMKRIFHYCLLSSFTGWMEQTRRTGEGECWREQSVAREGDRSE